MHWNPLVSPEIFNEISENIDVINKDRIPNDAYKSKLKLITNITKRKILKHEKECEYPNIVCVDIE
jgi:hypothetical protein